MATRNTYYQDETVRKKLDIRQFGKVLRYAIPYRTIMLWVVVLMIFSSVISLLSPILLKQIINVTVVNKDYRELVLVTVGLVVLAIIEIAVTFIHQRLSGKMGQKVISTIRKDVFYRLQQLPFDYFDSIPDGKIVVRVTDYINELANFFTNSLVMLLVYLVKIVIVIFFMLGISPQLTLVVLATVIPMMAAVFLLRFYVRRIFPEHRAKIANRTAFIVETIMGEKVMKAYNRSKKSREIYEQVHQASTSIWMSIVRKNELNTPIVEVFWNMGMLCLYGVALSMILSGHNGMDAGTVVVFTNYMGLFSGPLTQIAVIIQQFSQVSSNLERVFDTIEYPSAIEEKEDAIVLENVKGKVDFCDITFAYEEGVNVLENFNLHVEPGQTIALVGPTGAGKTTIINMLTRFYDVQKGKVLIDNMDVRDVTLESLRKEVGVLMQDPFIFKGTVLENIRYGKPDATDEECMEAARTIHAEQRILQMKDGYQHVLEERGLGLSAGEKQLISFARIILKNPSVIILDEATSSVDTETEALIQEALAVVLENKTAFIVAHRLSTVRNADKILFIDNKGIVESGTHEELMQLRGRYYCLN